MTETTIDPNDFTIYPNPSNGIMTLNFGTQNLNNYSYKITAPSGQIILENEVKESLFNIDLTGVTKGIYILIVQNDNEISNQRIVIE